MAYRTTETEGRPSEQKDQRPSSKEASGRESLRKRENNGKGASSIEKDTSHRLALRNGLMEVVGSC